MRNARCSILFQLQFCIFLIFTSYICLAKATVPIKPSLSFETIESLGSDSQSILSLLQDKQGFIWIGTIEGGLYRYDGRRAATKYANDINDSRSLPAGRVTKLFLDGRGRVWAGTDEGLARFEPLTNNFIRFMPPSGNDNGNTRIIRGIVSDNAGGIWLATWGGVQHFDLETETFKLYQANPQRTDTLAHNDVNAISVDEGGGVWAATWPGGLDYLASGQDRFVHYRLDLPTQPDPKINDVRALRLAPNNELWMGTDKGVMIWKVGSNWSTRRHLKGISGRVNSIDIDGRGNIWISTRTEGLFRWNAETQSFQQYTHHSEDNHSLPTNAINATLEDSTGVLWVATFANGVARAKLGNYAFHRVVPLDVAPPESRTSNFVRSIAVSNDGNIWLGSENGLSLYDPRKNSISRRYMAGNKNSGTLINNNSINSLYQEPNGPLWVGTTLGLNRLDTLNGKIKSIRFGSDSENSINAVVPGKGSVLWLATGGSLIRYEMISGKWQRFVHDDANPTSRKISEASTVLEDSKGRLWVGNSLRAAGLDVMSSADGHFENFHHDPKQPRSISGDKVTCLHEDSQGVVWVGTTQGLNRVVINTRGEVEFINYLSSTKNSSTIIESIKSDRSGMLWISTAKGVSRFDPSKGTFSHFASAEGISEGMYIRSSAASIDGQIYFGASSGLTVIRPNLPLIAPIAPRAAIVDIRVKNRSLSALPWPEEVLLKGSVSEPFALSIPWSARELTLEFAALHYDAPAQNTIAYWLEGFDQDWIVADANHPLKTYTNLYPGTYRFHLRAINNKGVSGSEINLDITVTPPFWQTWWFRSLAAILLMLMLFAIYRLRVRALRRRARRLEALVKSKTQALQESNQKLKELSSTDSMTGLANRRCFDAALEQEWSRAKRSGESLALAIFDVDHFKLYNDYYGHPAGDACLREVAGVLKHGLKRSIDLAARYGGEEFVFLAPLTSSSQAFLIAERIRNSLEAMMLPHEKATHGIVTVSVGVAAMTPTGKELSSMLIQLADQALYQAKAEGRNRTKLA